MAGRYTNERKSSYMKKDEDFDEGEVWGVMEERESNPSPRLKKLIKNKKDNSPSSQSTSSRARMIPRSSSSSNEAPVGKQFSAPLDIPDWSKIYGKNTNSIITNKKKTKNVTSSSATSPWVTSSNVVSHDNYLHDDDDVGYNYGYNHSGYVGNDVDGDDDDDEDGLVPPHEYLASKLARSQISSFSVYEGIGRTLKGRDLSRVRNAILTKTGFLE